ncbi:MAG TPA: alkaline phosphatase family protein [Candidatus Cybelea sp.]|jgi:phospholipase C|nr:alkaline phosphatase family protein [Candidatus Cybelea sp.]
MRTRSRSLCTAAIAVAFAASGCAQQGSVPLAGASHPLAGVGRNSGTQAYVQHVIIMIQENRSFDDFFATFPGADGATEGLMKTSSGEQEVPLTKAPLDSLSLGHEHFTFDKEYDHGAMDGFNRVDVTIQRGDKKPAGTYAYRYVNPNDIKPYWKIASQYVLGDHMFTTQSSSSFTAHQDLIAGGTPVGQGRNVIDFPTPSSWGCDASPGTVTSLITSTGKYLKDKGPYPCFSYLTMRDLLDGGGVSWDYFTNTLNGYVWNAFEAIDAVRNGPEWSTNIIQPQTKIYDAISGGTLPAVSWLIPDASDSDHPGSHSDSGPSWVASVVNAVGESAYWQNTVVIVVWDDWGGEYDNVPPPQLDGQGLGMRVPMLLVSAYARETSSSQPGYISHTQYEFGSLLKFIEQNWGLGSLGTSDERANNILDCFDFTQKPRPFQPLAVKYPKSYFQTRPPSNLPVDTD